MLNLFDPRVKRVDISHIKLDFFVSLKIRWVGYEFFFERVIKSTKKTNREKRTIKTRLDNNSRLYISKKVIFDETANFQSC